jgi:hypothetical protein
MVLLRGDRRAARQHARDRHQPGRTRVARVACDFGSAPGVLRTGAHDDRDAGRDQSLHAFLALLVRK